MLCLLGPVSPARAWDYEGHRTVNLLAVESLPDDFPAFVRAPAARERIAFLSGEPDRWRNTPDLPLRHVNGPDHFIDLEELADFDLKVELLTPFRHVFVEQLAHARARHPERFPAIPVEQNRDRTRQYPGFLPWAIMECYSRLKSALSYHKVFEQLGTPEEIENARANVIHLMGVMGHFAGDAAQPLHTTKHFNGWAGDNPAGYTTARTFHSWIDGGYLARTGGIAPEPLRERLRPAAAAQTIQGRTDFIFPVITRFVVGQHQLVEPLYRMEKAGELKGEAGAGLKGRPVLEAQILKGAQFLGDLWLTAWRNAHEDTYLTSRLNERRLKSTSPAVP